MLHRHILVVGIVTAIYVSILKQAHKLLVDMPKGSPSSHRLMLAFAVYLDLCHQKTIAFTGSDAYVTQRFN